MKKLYDLGLLSIGMLWGLGFITAKIAFNDGISPMQLLVIRFFLATLVLSILFYKVVLTINKKDFKEVFWLGVIMTLGYAFQLVGSKYTTASKAAFYTALNIVFVPYVAWILHKKSPEIKTYISTLLGIIGIFFISYERGLNLFQLNIGDVLIIISAFFFGTQIAMTGTYVQKIEVKKLVLLQLYISTILFIILYIPLAIFTNLESFSALSKIQWYSVIYLGVINSGLCIFGQVFFQKYVSEVKTSLLLTTESLFAPFFAYLILKEHIGLNVIIGAVFIFLALIILEIKIDKGSKYEIK